MKNAPLWAVQQIVRHDRNGMLEDVCKHGVGHPNRAWLEAHPRDGGIHGCDRCCAVVTGVHTPPHQGA